MMRRLLFLLTGSVLYVQLYAQPVSRPVPPGIYPYTFEKFSASFQGYYYLSPLSLGPSAAGHVVPQMLDADGYLAWYMPNTAMSNTDFKYFEDREVYGFIRSKNGYGSYQLMDTNFVLIDSLRNVNGISTDAHEWLILSNGNYIIGGERDSVMDLSAYTFNGNPGSAATVVEGYVIQEFNAAHTLVFQWNSNEHIHPTEAYEMAYGYNANGFDYCHGNAICEDNDGNLLVSFRHLDAVYKIDHTTGAVIWRLGGKSSDFTFTNDAGFSGQHDIRMHPDGSISLFDNGNRRPPPRKSRALQYTLDTISWTATRTYEYIHTAPLAYTMAMGNHQITADGFHCIGYGLIYRPKPSVVLLDDTQQPVSKIYLADSVVSYRAYVFNHPLHLQRPEITCSMNGSILILNAPSGHSAYQWSTGDTTQSISVTTTGEYQVWVNQGLGMIGSLPFIVTSTEDACTVGIGEEAPDLQPAPIVAIYDLLGRQMPASVPGQYYIIQRSDGSRQLKYCTEKGF